MNCNARSNDELLGSDMVVNHLSPRGSSPTIVFTHCRLAFIHRSAMATFHSLKLPDLGCSLALHLCVIRLIVSPSAVLQATCLRVPMQFLVFPLIQSVILGWTGVISLTAAARYYAQL